MEDRTRGLRPNKEQLLESISRKRFHLQSAVISVTLPYSDWREHNHCPIKTSPTDFEKEQPQAAELNAATIPLDC